MNLIYLSVHSFSRRGGDGVKGVDGSIVWEKKALKAKVDGSSLEVPLDWKD